MPTYIAFLSGINVGGQKKFPKADQMGLLKDLGFGNPRVYLHTGNWIFDTAEGCSKAETRIANSILKQYGWELPIVVKTAPELLSILEGCPFPEGVKEQSYFTLLHHPPSPEHTALVEAITFPKEEAHITSACVYFYAEKGYGDAKMNNNWLESKLKVTATTRNYNTMLKVLALAQNP